ncbi:MAG: hypothetical protein RRA32_05960 [bacterium]|nr:hypothetical protein [bacterium]
MSSFPWKRSRLSSIPIRDAAFVDIVFAVGADLDSAVVGAIRAIAVDERRPCQDGHVAETAHSMEHAKKALRLIAARRPVQGDLFEEENPRFRYKVIASNQSRISGHLSLFTVPCLYANNSFFVSRIYGRAGSCPDRRNL